MSYVEKNLMKDEKIIHQAKLHWIVYLWGLFISLVGILTIMSGGIMYLMLGSILCLFSWIKVVTSEFVITNKRIVMKVGLIKRISIETILGKVETVIVNQSIFGRILNYGTIGITGSGGSTTPFSKILSPIKFRQILNEQLEEIN